MEIIQKAYHVWHKGMIGFGPEIANSVDETEIVYAENPGQAKSEANDWKDWPLNGVDAQFTDLKCRRAKNADLVWFEGKPVKRFLIKSILSDRKREEKLKSFLKDEVLTHCYIMKRGTYYRPNSCGYTSFKKFAGIYSIEEGVKDAISCNELWLERTSIEDHNKMIKEAIKEMESRLLKPLVNA